jgi:hypothetical protein
MRILLVVILSSVLGGALGMAMANYSIHAWPWRAKNELGEESLKARMHIPSEESKARVEMLEERTYDFGVVNVSTAQAGNHVFKIKNIGEDPLTLKVAETSCSCTGVDITPTRVPPGETAEMNFKWDAENKTGKYTQSALIDTNDPNDSTIQLRVEGLYMAPVMARPFELIFSRVYPGDEATGHFRLFGFQEKPLEIEKIEYPDTDHFRITYSKAEMTEEEKDSNIFQNAKNAVEFEVHVLPGLPLGPFEQRIKMTTNYPQMPHFIYTIRGMVTGSMAVIGSGYNKKTGVLEIGTVQPLETVMKTVMLRFSGPNVEEIDPEVVELRPEWIDVQFEKPIDAQKDRIFPVTVVISGGSPMSNYQGPSEEQMGMIRFDPGVEGIPEVKLLLQFSVEKE